jgi:DNA-directed RNA polymerase subunit RPC12/RpoP
MTEQVRESREGEEIEEEIEEPGQSANIGFPCDGCGADMTWDPEVDAMNCDHCGAVVQVPRAEGVIVERALSEAGEATRGLGLELRVSECENCGARVSFEEATTSQQCVYCGSPSVLEQEANRNAIRPESLIPLDVGRTAVEANFRRWIGGLWFRPNELKKTRRFDAVGIYVPFWTFDCGVHSDWSADAGHYYWVTQSYWTRTNGRRVRRTRRVRKVRWVPAWGQRDDAYDDLLVLASGGQPAGLVRKLGEFDTSALVPYRPEYLAGWRAEEYRLDLDGAWEEGAAMVVGSQRRRCAGDVPGDTQRNLRVQNRIFDVRWKHVLLPIWSVQYAFKGETYTVLVHGQTGRVVGKAPLSWVKVVGLVLAVLAGAALIAALVFAVGLAS